MNKLWVIGYGPGHPDFLTQRARDLLDKAERILSTDRIGAEDARVQHLGFGELLDELRHTGAGLTVVLVSGDSGFYSAARLIVRDFGELYDVELLPGIGSLQYMSAALKVAWDDAELVSLHGRQASIVARVAYNAKVFALTGGDVSAATICAELTAHRLGDVAVTVGTRLSYSDEQIVSGRARELCGSTFDDLAVVYIENQNAVNPAAALPDSAFIRGDVPMTKEEVRWLSLLRLAVEPGDTVYDIGAGTGSVAIEIARRATDGFVYAIEAEERACELINQNAAALGAANLEVIAGFAPQVLAGLPQPNKAFIGGSSGNMLEICQALTDVSADIRVVANAVTLQTLGDIQSAFAATNIAILDIACINVAKAVRRGNYDMMTAQNPVYIITGQGGGGALGDESGGSDD